MTIEMKLTIDRDDLSDALARVEQVVTSSTVEYLQRILGEVSSGWLVLTGSNSILSVKTGISLDDVEGKPGMFVFPPEAAQAVAALPAGDVFVEIAHNAVFFTSEHGQVFQFKKFNPVDFPKLGFPDKDPITIDGETLSKIIRYLGTMKSETTLIEGHEGHMRIVTTDKYRLAVVDIPEIPFDGSVVVPSEFFTTIEPTIGIDDVLLSIDDTRISMRNENRALTVQRSAEEFPTYQKMTKPFDSENEFGTLAAPRADLLGATRRAQVLTVKKSYIPLRLALSKKYGAEVTMSKTDVGQENERVKATWTGEPTEIAYNIGFLRDGLQAFSGESVVLTVEAATRPAMLQGADDPMFRYFLMPVRI